MKLAASVASLVVFAALARGDFFMPMIMGVDPLALQTGKTVDHEVSARYDLKGSYQVLVSGQGVTGTIVPPDPPKPGEKPAPSPAPNSKIRVKFAATADAQPGVRDFRIAGPNGVSTTGQLVITRDPVMAEKGDNDTREKAIPITLPAAVCGVIEKAEDVDFFKFTLAKPATLTFHVQSARCEDRIHDLQIHVDPILTIRNAHGAVIAMNDNYFYADPLISYRFLAAGDYYLEIRDVRYQGNVHWLYVVEISERPLITNAHPIAVAPGKSEPRELIGFNLPPKATGVFAAGANLPDGGAWLQPKLGSELGNPVPVYVSRLPLAVETAVKNDKPEEAQAIAVPAGVSGRIESENDIDCYSFTAKKGDRFTFEVEARRHQSALDPTLRLFTEKQPRLVESDDQTISKKTCADPVIENFTAPADGKYFLEVRDLHLRGGREYVYFLTATKSELYFRLETDYDRISLAPGTYNPLFVKAYRKNGFAGEIQLAMEGLPAGVKATCGRILANGTDGCIILEADKGAKLSVSNVNIFGRSLPPPTDPKLPASKSADADVVIAAAALPMQEIYMPGGGRGMYPVETETVCVCGPMDLLSMKISTNNVSIKPGGSQKIDVVIERAPGYEKNVTLDVAYRHLAQIYANSLPQGITVDDKASRTVIAGKQVQGYIVLKAAADAPPAEKQLIPIMAQSAVNFVVKNTYCAEPCYITVLPK